MGTKIEGNKLIALDLNTGDTIWDPVVLPTGSFSTPAVDDGLIFVGCENFDGGSIFVFALTRKRTA